MKKILIMISALTSLIGLGQEVPLDGNFSGQRCNGSVGLCTISQGGTGYGKNTGESKLKAKKMDGFHFQLIIDRNKISKEEELRIVGKELSSLMPSTLFEVEEDFLLDTQTAGAIGLTQDYTIIPKGKYPMVIEENSVYISFTVEKN